MNEPLKGKYNDKYVSMVYKKDIASAVEWLKEENLKIWHQLFNNEISILLACEMMGKLINEAFEDVTKKE